MQLPTAVAAPASAAASLGAGAGSKSQQRRSSSGKLIKHVRFTLLLALLTVGAAAAAAATGYTFSNQLEAGRWWPDPAPAGSSSMQQQPSRRTLLQNRWGLLGLRSRGGILQQLLTATDEQDEAATSAAMAAAIAQGRASRLLLTDLDPDTAGSGAQAPPRFLATAAQGPVGTASQAMLPIGSDAQPVCSATINYGASVGDASKKATADVPIYVGSFDVVVTQPQGVQPSATLKEGDSRWVLGWQFAAGEYLQMSRDVFGDEGIRNVYMSPSLQGPAEGAEGGLSPALPGRDQTPQHVAVFSNTSLDSSNSEVVFSFVGRKGPDSPVLKATAPFRVAPPTYVFLNNHYCWPLFRPQGSSGGSPAAVAAAVAGSGAAVGRGGQGGAGVQAQVSGAGQQQQQMVEVATPRLDAANMPRRVQVEYLPVEFVAKEDDPALFAKTVTQFYFKITNLAAEPVFLDQVLLQYWFHGPLDGSVAGSSDNSSIGSADVDSVVAQVSAAQFRLTCSDASAEIGCGGLAWNVTPGLPTAFGARFVLNVWFPAPSSSNSSGDSSAGSNSARRFVLLPASGNSSAGSNSTAGAAADVVFGPGGKPLLQQSLTDMQAIVAIEPRRFFANISATNDYSFADTPVLGPQPGANSSTAGGGGQLVRRRREPNSRMPAYISQQLAWGSPPVGGSMAPRPGSGSSAGSKSAFPPGSYCQPSPGGGLVCGIDVLYCCVGSDPLNLTGVPADWLSRLMSSSNSSGASNETMGGLGLNSDSAGVLRAQGSSSKGDLDPWALALAVALPVLAVLVAAAAGVAAFVRRRRRRRSAAARQFKSLSESSDGSRSMGGRGVLADWQGQPDQYSRAGWGAGAGTAGGSQLAALLSSSSEQQGTPPAAGWAAAGLDAAEKGHGVGFAAGSGLQPQQQLAEWQLIHRQQQQQAVGGASGQHSQLLLQANSSTASGMAAAAAAAASPRQLLRVLRPKVPSLPANVIAAAAKFARQQHLQQQASSRSRSSGSDSDGRPGSPFAQASRLPFGEAGACYQAEEDCAARDVRSHTWTGRLHEDAFEDDLLDQLLSIHMRPQQQQLLNTAAAAAAAAAAPTTDSVWQQLQQQQQQQQSPSSFGAGAAAAAVEAAVAAINALLSGTASTPRAPPSAALNRQPLAESAAGGFSSPPQAGSPPQGSSPSFYRALMATGGVLRPPGGPPIPLNVDYATEIQPHLGRLLGRGGFGAVYEGTWRGQRVAVKLLTVDTEDPAVLDAFLKEVALCACLRGCDRVVRLLGACLGGCSTPPPAPPSQSQSPPPANPAAAAEAAAVTAAGASSSFHTSSSASSRDDSALKVPSVDITPFQSELPPDVAADDTPPGSTNGGPQQQQQQWALIMELVEGGNLAHRIYHPSKRSLSYLEILQIGLDIASGLSYLHPAVVHRDLKPQNVLLDKQGRAKIADFGISRFKDPHRSYLSVTHQGGTPCYMAPELFNASRVDEAADVYSLGCILYECLAKQQPFGHLAEEGKSFNVLFKIIVAVAINKERPPLPHDTPPRLAALISRCWSEDPAGRPHVNQLLAELQDMMREALQERAQRTGRLSRMNSTASRTHSLPAQPLHHRQDSTGSITSNTSVGTGSSSPSRVHPVVRGARTLPMPPQNSMASSLAAGSDSAASFGVWSPQPSTGSQYPGRSSSAAVLTLPTSGSAPPLPSIGAVIAAGGSSSSSRAAELSQEGPHAAAAAAALAEGVPGSNQLPTGAAAGVVGHGEAEQQDPSSPRPFQDQQLLMLQQQQAHAQQQRHQHHHHSHSHQQQQQQLGPCASLASSVSSRQHWHCPCFGSPEPCAACAGSTSSSDCGSSHAGCGSSGGGSVQRTPSSSSPLNLSPISGARQLHVLPQIPQDAPAFPLQLPSSSSTAAADAGSCGEAAGCVQPASMQLSTLQPPLLRPKTSVVSPQTPARRAHVGRKPSSQASSAAADSHCAAGALFTSGGSVPADALASTASGSPAYTPSAPTAATAYPVLMYPSHTASMAATTATALGSQPAAALQQRLPGSSAGSSSSGVRLQQQGSADLPRQPSGGLRKQARTSAGHAGSSSGSDAASPAGIAVAAATPAAGSSLGSGLPRHRRSNSSGSSNGSGSILLRSLASAGSDTAIAGGATSEQAQQLGTQQSQQQHSSIGVLRSAGSLHPALQRSFSSVPSEGAAAAAAGELSSSQSSSPSAVGAAGPAVGSVCSCSTGVSRLRSFSLDFGSASLYTNPLFGLGAAGTGAVTSSEWQEPPLLQMQHSAPAGGRRAGRSLAAAAVERSALSAAAASAGRPASVPLCADRDSADSGLISCGTVFMTARSQAVAGSCADSGFAAEGLGDFSLHGSASSRLTCTPSADPAAVQHAGAAAGGHVQAAVRGVGSRIDEVGAVAAAAAAGHGGGGSTRSVEAGAVAAAAAAAGHGHGSSAGLAVARKVSFAEAEPEVLG